MGKQVAARLKQNNFNIPNGGVAQLGEHLPCKQGVKGSNPFISTVIRKRMTNKEAPDGAQKEASDDAQKETPDGV